jgi:hypothetical protein
MDQCSVHAQIMFITGLVDDFRLEANAATRTAQGMLLAHSLVHQGKAHRAADSAQLAECCREVAKSIEVLGAVWRHPESTESLFRSAVKLVSDCQAKARAWHSRMYPGVIWTVQYQLYSSLRIVAATRRIYLATLSKSFDVLDLPNLSRRIRDLEERLRLMDTHRQSQSAIRHRRPHRPQQVSVPRNRFLVDLLREKQRSNRGRVLFSPEAFRAAREFTHPVGERVGIALDQLGTTLWDLYFDPAKKSRNLEQDFLMATGMRLALKEGRLTNRNKQMLRERQVEVDGKVYDMLPHIKVPCVPEDLRIYFNPDHEKRLIVVGSCGRHERTAGTMFCR